MIVYAIRYINGKYLPPGKGSTYWEPTTEYTEDPPIPRFFSTKGGAQSTISHWVKGYAKPDTRSEGSWDEPSYIIVSGVTYEIPEIPRSRSDLIIEEWSATVL